MEKPSEERPWKKEQEREGRYDKLMEVGVGEGSGTASKRRKEEKEEDEDLAEVQTAM